jgi:hypothetical protein
MNNGRETVMMVLALSARSSRSKSQVARNGFADKLRTVLVPPCKRRTADGDRQSPTEPAQTPVESGSFAGETPEPLRGNVRTHR